MSLPPSSPPHVSIVICTRNRADSLGLTLQSIARLAPPADWRVELLVVNNGSTDRTAAVLESTRLGNLPLRVVDEPVAGLSRARNAGLRHAAGRAVLFTDDDVRLPPDWVQRMARRILDGQADAVAGGVVFPPEIARALDRPVLSTHRTWFASTEDLDAEKPQRMVGANMGFGRHVLEKVPDFDPHLGAGGLGFGEETLFSWRVLHAGYRIAGALDVQVEHHFDTSRLTRDTLLGMARKMGVSEGYLAWHWEHLSRPSTRGLLRMRAKFWCRTALGRLRPPPAEAQPWEISYHRRMGFHEQFARESRQPRKYSR